MEPGVQHQFGGNMTASLGYVGNKIDHLSDIYLYNQKQINSTGQVVPGPFMQKLIVVANGVGQARYNASDGISTLRRAGSNCCAARTTMDSISSSRTRCRSA